MSNCFTAFTYQFRWSRWNAMLSIILSSAQLLYFHNITFSHFPLWQQRRRKGQWCPSKDWRPPFLFRLLSRQVRDTVRWSRILWDLQRIPENFQVSLKAVRRITDADNKNSAAIVFRNLCFATTRLTEHCKTQHYARGFSAYELYNNSIRPHLTCVYKTLWLPLRWAFFLRPQELQFQLLKSKNEQKYAGPHKLMVSYDNRWSILPSAESHQLDRSEQHRVLSTQPSLAWELKHTVWDTEAQICINPLKVDLRGSFAWVWRKLAGSATLRTSPTSLCHFGFREAVK